MNCVLAELSQQQAGALAQSPGMAIGAKQENFA